jgi:hypothetical protein
MPCIPVPSLPVPNLPNGINLSPPTPSVSTPGISSPCCLLPPLQSVKPPIQLPPIVANPAFVGVIRGSLAIVAAYKLATPTKCPRG